MFPPQDGGASTPTATAETSMKKENSVTFADNKKDDVSGDDEKEPSFEDSPRFKQIVKMMRESSLGLIITDSVDFSKLQSIVLEVICVLMGKKELKISDRKIIESALDLWTASILENPHLLKEFYAWKRTEE